MKVAGFAPAVLLAVGLGAPQPGTEVEVGGGSGAYHYTGGCDGPHNDVNFLALQLRARQLRTNGMVMAGEAAGQRGEIVSSEGGSTPSQLGRQETLYALAVRLGYEGRYGGFELGPGVLRSGVGQHDHVPGTTVLPSVRLWLGRYGIAHAWAALLADRTLPTNRIAGFGIGHASARVRASLGLSGSAGRDATFIADADVAVGNGLWLGAGGQFTDNDETWGVLGRVGFRWGGERPRDADARRPDEQPPVEAPPPVPAPPPPMPQPDGSAAPAPSVEVHGVEIDAGA